MEIQTAPKFSRSKLRHTILINLFKLSSEAEYHKDIVYTGIIYIDRYWSTQFRSDEKQQWIDPFVRAISFGCLHLALKMCHQYDKDFMHPLHRKNKIVSIEEQQTDMQLILQSEIHVLITLQWNLYVPPKENPLYWFNQFHTFWCSRIRQQTCPITEFDDCKFRAYIFWVDILLLCCSDEQLSSNCIAAFTQAYSIQNINEVNLILNYFHVNMNHKNYSHYFAQVPYEVPTIPNVWSKRTDDAQEWIQESLKQKFHESFITFCYDNERNSSTKQDQQ